MTELKKTWSICGIRPTATPARKQNADTYAQTVQPITAPFAPARSLKPFTEESYDDVDDWLDRYERTARFN